MTAVRFHDRRHAGRALAARLEHLRGRSDLVVLGLPRGGVPVAYEVARALDAPLDVFIVRKLGVPGQEELAMGALASGGTTVLNDEVLHLLRIPQPVIDEVARREARELRRRETLYRGAREPVEVAGRTVVLTDDGIATGSSMLAAVHALRRRGPARLIVAVPVAAHSVAERLREIADEVVCVTETDMLDGVSLWYDDFEQTQDDEVRELLARRAPADTAASTAGTPASAKPTQASTEPSAADRPAETAVTIDAAGARIAADLVRPAGAEGLVIFAHGSGSSRKSRRNRFVASVLNNGGFATLLLDLLTADEERVDERTGHLRFDIGLLTSRLVAATDWAAREPSLQDLPVGLFGASTGAAAALLAAARRPNRIAAVVSRGGRPDLAMDALRIVRAPVLLIVGGRDTQVIELNREAFEVIQARKELTIVPGATHLFEEPGALERVAALALDWFREHLAPAPSPANASART